MSVRGWACARAAGIALVAIAALEVLLPYVADAALDPSPRSAQRARAFHRALFRYDAETLESLESDLRLCQSELPSEGLGAAGAESAGIEIATNAHGLRMRACALERERSVLRIAVLGDSVSFGWRVREAECWPRVLEAHLREAGLRVEVLNFAVPGFTTPQAAAQLRSRVLKFEPALVILATGFNDAWLRPGPGDVERLQRAARTSALAAEMFAWQRESSILRAVRRIFGGDELGVAAHTRRAPSAQVLAALAEAIALARSRGAEVVLADVCLPHARAGDLLRAAAAASAAPFFDGRACLGYAEVPCTPLQTPRRLRVPVDTALRERWSAARDELLALAFPPDRVEGLGDLELRPLRWDGRVAELELEPGAERDVAIVPRSYLEAAPASWERLMTLVYHRIPDGPPEGELRAGRFAGAAYEASDAPHAEHAHGEAIHPNSAGHALLAAGCARFLLARPHLLALEHTAKAPSRS